MSGKMMQSVLPSQWLSMLREVRDYGISTSKHPLCSLRRMETEAFADALAAMSWSKYAGSSSALDDELLNPLAPKSPQIKLNEAGRTFLCSVASLLDVHCLDIWTAACCVVGLPSRLASGTMSGFSVADMLRIRNEHYSQRVAMLQLACEVFLSSWHASPASGPCSFVAQQVLSHSGSMLLKLKEANRLSPPEFKAHSLLETLGAAPHSASAVEGELRGRWSEQAVLEQALLLRCMHTAAYTHASMTSAQWVELACILDAHPEFKPPLALVEQLPATAAAQGLIAKRQHQALLALLTPLIAGFSSAHISTTRFAFQDEGLQDVKDYMRQHVIPVVESAPPSTSMVPPTLYQGAAAALYVAWLTLNMLEHNRSGAVGVRQGADALQGASMHGLQSVIHGEPMHLALQHLHRVVQELDDDMCDLHYHSSVQHWCRSVRGAAWGECVCTGGSRGALFSSSNLDLRLSSSIQHSCHDAEMWALAPALRAMAGDGWTPPPAGGRAGVSTTDDGAQSVCIVIHDLFVGLLIALERMGCAQPPALQGWWVATAAAALRGAPDRAAVAMSTSSPVPGVHAAHMYMLAHASAQFPLQSLPCLRLLCSTAGEAPEDAHKYLRHQFNTFTTCVTASSTHLAFPVGQNEGATVVLRQPLLCEAAAVLLPAGIAGTLVAAHADLDNVHAQLNMSCPLSGQSEESTPHLIIKWHWRQPAVPVLLHRFGWLVFQAARGHRAQLGLDAMAEMVETCDLLHSLLMGAASHQDRLQQLRQIAADVVRARRYARCVAAEANGNTHFHSFKAAKLSSDPYNVNQGGEIPTLATSDIVQWLMHALASAVCTFSSSPKSTEGVLDAWAPQSHSEEQAAVADSSMSTTQGVASFRGASSAQHSVALSAASGASATKYHVRAAVADERFEAWSCRLTEKSAELLTVLGSLAPAEMADVLGEPLGSSSPLWAVPHAAAARSGGAHSSLSLSSDAPVGVQIVHAVLSGLETRALPSADCSSALALTGLLSSVLRSVLHHSVRLTAERAFSLFDLDGDGDISLAEFADTLKALGVSADQQVVQTLVAHLDMNGDGQVQYNEFIRLVAHEVQLADAMDDGTYEGDSSALEAKVALFVRQLVHRQPARRQLLGDLAFCAAEAMALVLQRILDWQAPLDRWLVGGKVLTDLHLLTSCAFDVRAPSLADSKSKQYGLHTSEVISLDRSMCLSDAVVTSLLGAPAARATMLACCCELGLSGLDSLVDPMADLRSVWNHSVAHSLPLPEHADALHSFTSTALSVLMSCLGKCSSMQAVAQVLCTPLAGSQQRESPNGAVSTVLTCMAAYCTYHLTDPAVEPHESQLVAQCLQTPVPEEVQEQLKSHLNLLAARVVTPTDIAVQAAGFFPLAVACAAQHVPAAKTYDDALQTNKRQRILGRRTTDALVDSYFDSVDPLVHPAHEERKVQARPTINSQALGLPQWYKAPHLVPHDVTNEHHLGFKGHTPSGVSIGSLVEQILPQLASAVTGQHSLDEPTSDLDPLRVTDAPRVVRLMGLKLATFSLSNDLPAAVSLVSCGTAQSIRHVSRPSALLEAMVAISAAERLMTSQPALLLGALELVCVLASKSARRPWALSSLTLLCSQDDFWTGLLASASFDSTKLHAVDSIQVDSVYAVQLLAKASAVQLLAQLCVAFAQQGTADLRSKAEAAVKSLTHSKEWRQSSSHTIIKCLELGLADSLSLVHSVSSDTGINLAAFRAGQLFSTGSPFIQPATHAEFEVGSHACMSAGAICAEKPGTGFLFQLPALLATVSEAGVASSTPASSLEAALQSSSLQFSLGEAAGALAQGIHGCCLALQGAQQGALALALAFSAVMRHSAYSLKLDLVPVLHMSRSVLSQASAYSDSLRHGGSPEPGWADVLMGCAEAADRLVQIKPVRHSVDFPVFEAGHVRSVELCATASQELSQLADSSHMLCTAATCALLETCCLLIQAGVHCPISVVHTLFGAAQSLLGSSHAQQGRPLPLVWAGGAWRSIPQHDQLAKGVMKLVDEEFSVCAVLLDVLLQHESLRDGQGLQSIACDHTIQHLLQVFVSSCDQLHIMHEWHAAWWRKQLVVIERSSATGPHLSAEDASQGALPVKPDSIFVETRSSIINTCHNALCALMAIARLPGGSACLLAAGAFRALSNCSLAQGVESVLQAQAQHTGQEARHKSPPSSNTGSLSTAVLDSQWWGVGFGLGPALVRGYDHQGQPCSAHALWRSMNQFFALCVTNCTQDKREEQTFFQTHNMEQVALSAAPSSAPVLSRRVSAALSSTSVEQAAEEQAYDESTHWKGIAQKSSRMVRALNTAPAVLHALESVPGLRRSMAANQQNAWLNGYTSHEHAHGAKISPSAGCVLDAVCQEAISFIDKTKHTVVSSFMHRNPSEQLLKEISANAHLLAALLHPDCAPTWLRICNNQAATAHGGRRGVPYPAWEQLLVATRLPLDKTLLLGNFAYPIAVLLAAAEDCTRSMISHGGKRGAWLPRERHIPSPAGEASGSCTIQVGTSTLHASVTQSHVVDGHKLPAVRQALLGCTDGLAHAGSSSNPRISTSTQGIDSNQAPTGCHSPWFTRPSTFLPALNDLLAVCVAGTQHVQSPLSQLLSESPVGESVRDEHRFESRQWAEFLRIWKDWAQRAAAPSCSWASRASAAAVVQVASQHADLYLQHKPRGSLFGFNSRSLFGCPSGAHDVLGSSCPPGTGHMLLLIAYCMQQHKSATKHHKQMLGCIALQCLSLLVSAIDAMHEPSADKNVALQRAVACIVGDAGMSVDGLSHILSVSNGASDLSAVDSALLQRVRSAGSPDNSAAKLSTWHAGQTSKMTNEELSLALQWRDTTSSLGFVAGDASFVHSTVRYLHELLVWRTSHDTRQILEALSLGTL